jgi:hypothetical protein
MSFCRDFWESELTDRKCLSKCHFVEILADIYFSYNLSFWGDFWDQKRLKMGSKCHFGEILGNQKRPKMAFWENIGRYIFSYNVSFLGDFGGSELTDRKCLKCHFGEIFENLVSGKLNYSKKTNFGAPRRT